ncbi:MAG: acyl-CoA dehydrogenase family protein, partial [Acidimicrobiales bacterium]
MDFAVTEEQADLRAELRRYFQDLLTPERQAKLWADEMGGPVWKDAVKQIAADGWLGIGWPKEYGGQDRSPIEQLIFFDEAQRAEAPVPMLSINTVGPTIMRFGTQDQKDRFLPGILRGELNFAIGYTEPG